MVEAFYEFKNGVVVYNATPHPVTIQDMDGELVSVQPGTKIDASAIEVPASNLFVTTKFVGTEEGEATIASIHTEFEALYGNKGIALVIIGSIIAAQAYPERVFGMRPVPGHERVASAEKRMRCDKFTVFLKGGDETGC